MHTTLTLNTADPRVRHACRMITLHRLSLFDSTSLIPGYLRENQLSTYAARLTSSKSICINSARCILGVFQDLGQNRPSCRLLSCHAFLTAIFVLAVQTYKHATTWQAMNIGCEHRTDSINCAAPQVSLRFVLYFVGICRLSNAICKATPCSPL